MEISFEPMSEGHRKAIIDIYNHYIDNSFSAYPDSRFAYGYFDRFLEMTRGYPAFALMDGETVAGFCFLRPWNPLPTFKGCAEITYFIGPEYTGKGIGTMALERLEAEARKMGIRTILASIASENRQSLNFHGRNGFRECGRFEKVIEKKGVRFDVVWMQKDLDQPANAPS